MADWARISDEADPDRCQGIDGTGQCRYKRNPPSNFCPRHGGNKAAEAAKKEAVRNLRLTQWKNRVGELADSPQIKSLREEIGIIRLIMEETLNKCETGTDLILYSDKIRGLVQQAQKLVESCHRIEERSGQLLDKQTILVVCDGLVSLVSEFVTDGDILDTIAQRMVEVVARVGGVNVPSNAGAIAG